MQESARATEKERPLETPVEIFGTAFPMAWTRPLPAYVDLLTKAGVLLGGITYITGLLVVSLHLSAYGAIPLGFFAQQYVAAGAWALLPAVFGIASIALIQRAVTRKQPLAHTLYAGIRNPRIAQFFVIFAVLGVVGWLGWEMIATVGIGWHWGWAACYLLPAFLVCLTRISKAMNAEGPYDTLPDDMHAAYLAGLTGITAVAYSAIFAFGPFAVIPARLGGGSPIKARLLLKEPSLSALRTALAREPILSDSGFPIRVLMLTNDQVLFLPDICPAAAPKPNCSAPGLRPGPVLMNRQEVDAIIWPAVVWRRP